MQKKKAITIIASEETYQNLTTFDDIEQLNNTVRHYKETYADQLNKNTIRVLETLQRYSAKYKGVSFRTKNNIASELNISRRTVIRACQKLESLGIIKQYEMKRKSDMQQTSNAIVIQPVEQVGTQEKTKTDNNCHSKKTKTNTLKQKSINKRKENNVPAFDKSYVSSNIPEEFTDTVGSFYNADDIYKLWNRLTLSIHKALPNVSKSIRNDILYSNLSDYLKAFKESIYKLKQGKIKGSFFGYIYSVWNNITRHIDMRSNATKGIYYDWLAG